MNRDLAPLLAEWPYEPGKINVRLLQGDDGDPVIQVRLDLGVLQMRVDGRPDGQRPFGFPSLLDYHEDRADEPDDPDPADNTPAPVDRTPDADEDDRLGLTPDECRALREEAMQYAHRYIALFVLEDFEGVLRDTARNLRLIDFLARHAEHAADRAALEGQRAYVTMMQTRAVASQALRDEQPRAALRAIDRGIEALRALHERHAPAEGGESKEVQVLRAMREALVPKLPVSQKSELRARLDRAIHDENYELAAILRDELRLLPD